MEVKLTVDAKIFAVLKLFTAKKGEHYYMNGINLEIGRKETRLVAANGVMLGCFRVQSEQPNIDAPITDVIIPNELLEHLKPTGLVEIVIGEPKTVNNGKGEYRMSNARPITLTYNKSTVTGETMHGTFPHFRRLIPPKVSGKTAQFDPRFTGILSKAWSILHGNKGSCLVGLGHNGDDAALIDLKNHNFVGAIMPMNKKSVPSPVSAPSWVGDCSLRGEDA